MKTPYWLDMQDPQHFPDVNGALDEPDGLLALGGDLSIERLLHAYQLGIFPWYTQGQPIMWWSPNPRAILYPNKIHISKSLAKTIRKSPFTITFDKNFAALIQACMETRTEGTWITCDMQSAYINFHNSGYAHSVEVWKDEQLVGGLYGIALGKVFFGESMFSTYNDASKVALVMLCEKLVKHDFKLIDCQVHSNHMLRMGAEMISREQFSLLLKQFCFPTDRSIWY